MGTKIGALRAARTRAQRALDADRARLHLTAAQAERIADRVARVAACERAIDMAVARRESSGAAFRD